MYNKLNLNAIMYFESVARNAKISLAAKELLVSSSAVSQQIKSLENSLGIDLFRRAQNRLFLTEAGEQLYVSASHALSDLINTHSHICKNHKRSQLVVRVSASFGVKWLSMIIPDFINKNPNLDLHIDATSKPTNFEQEITDIEIRYNYDPPIQMYSKALIYDSVLPMCSPKLITNGESWLKMLNQHRLIHTTNALISWQKWLENKRVSGVEYTSGLRFNRSSMSIQAAVNGLGIALETATLAMQELKSGTLVPLAAELGVVRFPAYFVICSQKSLHSRLINEFVNWISTAAQVQEKEKTKLLHSLNCHKTINLLTEPENTSDQI